MPQNTYIMSTEGEITIINKDGEILKLSGIIDFTIEQNTGVEEARTMDGRVYHHQSGFDEFNVNITCAKLEMTQPSEITKKSVRRKIR